jgi:hypothetical protein
MDSLGVCAIFKNEASYLDEWIQFHLGQGFSRFFLFDDNSSDNFADVLEPYIGSGIVSLYRAPDHRNYFSKQRKTYMRGLFYARGRVRWLAFIDVDEFFFSPSGRILDSLPRSIFVAGVAVWWRQFGTSGHNRRPPGGVVENFTHASRFPTSLEEANEMRRFDAQYFHPRPRAINGGRLNVKSIVRPWRVLMPRIHFPKYVLGRLVDENGKIFSIGGSTPTQSKLRINHYWSKSLEELAQKSVKWIAHQPTTSLEDRMAWAKELNEHIDLVIQQVAPNSIKAS